ncbi:MAG TPA: mechanosensitive ion channel domain-containing protein [Blastocatellia bacterium]|nr:mechanosensitive ion channel domain-containing protein [Blastocatellia bacterium]
MTRLLSEIEQRLVPSPTVSGIVPELTRLEQEVNEQKIGVQLTIAEDPSLTELSGLETSWRARLDRYAEWQKELGERIRMLESDLGLLDTQQAQWQATIDRIAGDAALKEITDRVRSKIADIQAVRSRITEQTNEIVVLQNSISLQEQAVSETLGTITEAKGFLQRNLLVPNSHALWEADSGAPNVFKASRSRSLARFGQFIDARPRAIYVPLVVFAIALFLTIGFKRRLPRLTQENLIPEGCTHLFNRPVSLAMLAALMTAIVIPQMPVMMRNLIALLLLLPLVRLFLPLIRPVWRPLAYGLAAMWLVSGLVDGLAATDHMRRVGAAAIDAVGIVTFIWLLRRSRRSPVPLSKKAVLSLTGVRVALLILFASLVGNLFGYAALSQMLRVGVVFSAYLVVILYTTHRVLIALSSIILRSQLAPSMESVRLHIDQTLTGVSRTVAIIFFFVWLSASLNFFTIRSEVFGRVAEVLSTSISAGRISLSLGDVLVFLLTLFLGIIAAKVIRVLLREDIIPRLSPKRGLPSAVSTLIYYALVAVVFFLALSAGGAEFSKFTVMTGAFGLGVGFGLQTVINNLASGLLLLIERPINVGDVLEVGEVYGVVRRIGMRSSTIRTFEGAEVIVPNSDLVTNLVTNWTLSERQRRADIPIGVAYGTDPERVIKLLVDTASAHPDIVKDTPPVALFTGFGDSALNFELRFWCPQARTHQQLKSDVAVRIISAFREAGIEIPFPQTELHIKSVDPSIGRAAAAPEKGAEIVTEQTHTGENPRVHNDGNA